MDMTAFIIAKSDQLNSDDLIGGPITVTITGVRGTDASDQPVAVHFDGDDGKPYKPCKSMRRVMVGVWGPDASKYVGQSMTLHREAEVQFGGMKVGGIRISHMSGLTEKKTMALTATRGKKGLYTVYPLAKAAAPPKDDPAAKWASGYIAKLATFNDLPALEAFEADKARKLAELQTARPELHAEVAAQLAERKSELAGGRFDDDLIDTPDFTPEPQAAIEAEPDADHPARAKADAIIAAVNGALAIMDVNSIASRHKADIEAMPEDIADAVNGAIKARIAAIKAEREAAKADA